MDTQAAVRMLNDISVVDTETMEVIARVPPGERPCGIAIVPAERGGSHS